jgi:heme-degrading monooxygenase HmoA
VIRHIATVRFRPGTTEADVEAFSAALMALDVKGRIGVCVGPALRIREKDHVNYAMIIDFEDEAAFARWDTAPAHDELRAGLAARIIESGEGCQVRV